MNRLPKVDSEVGVWLALAIPVFRKLRRDDHMGFQASQSYREIPIPKVNREENNKNPTGTKFEIGIHHTLLHSSR